MVVRWERGDTGRRQVPPREEDNVIHILCLRTTVYITVTLFVKQDLLIKIKGNFLIPYKLPKS